MNTKTEPCAFRCEEYPKCNCGNQAKPLTAGELDEILKKVYKADISIEQAKQLIQDGIDVFHERCQPKEIEEMKNFIIAEYRKFGDEKALLIKSKRYYTGNEIAEEIEKGTELGIKTARQIIQLTVDLLKRGKESISESQTYTAEQIASSMLIYYLKP